MNLDGSTPLFLLLSEKLSEKYDPTQNPKYTTAKQKKKFQTLSFNEME